MNVGLRTYTPYVTLMGMEIMEYMRYETTLVRELQRIADEREAMKDR